MQFRADVSKNNKNLMEIRYTKITIIHKFHYNEQIFHPILIFRSYFLVAIAL